MEETITTTASPVMTPVNNSSVPPSNTSGKNPRMASFSERLGAFIIDSLILMAVSLPIQFSLGLMQGIGSYASSDMSAVFSGLSGISSLIGLLIQFGYFGWFTVTKGQTLGKMAMKIKVVRSADLNYISWGEAALREILGRIVSGLLLFLGYLWYFMSPKRQTWHDMIASTYVVKTDDAGNILMDGPAEYPKEPVKTFGCCAVFGLLIAGFIALMIYAIAIVGSGLSEEFRNGSMTPSYDSDVDIQNNYEWDVEGEEGTPMTEEEIQRYLEENFPELETEIYNMEPEAEESL